MSDFARMDAKGEEMLETVGWLLRDDPQVQAALGVIGREITRFEEIVTRVRLQMHPVYATDEFGLLSMWEALLGLPVAQAAASEDQRRGIVIAWLRGLQSSSGLAWEAALTQALGTSTWFYTENTGPYEITIQMPFEVATVGAQQVETLARAITPAHIDIAFTYGGGFIIGQSEIGVEDL